jgi:hypothetical protein
MIAAAPIPSQLTFQPDAGPRPLGELLPAVLARYGISAPEPASARSSFLETAGNWPQLETTQTLTGAGCMAVG